MSVLTKQPQGTFTIDWGNPLAKSLRLAQTSSSGLVDTVNKWFATKSASDEIRGVNVPRLGPAVSFKGARATGGGINFGQVQAVKTDAITVLVLANPNTTQAQTIFSQRLGSSPFNQFSFGVNSNTSLLLDPGRISVACLNVSGGARASYSVATTFTDNGWHVYVATFAGAPNYPVLYYDGESVVVTNQGTGTGTWVSSTQHTRIGNVADYTADATYAASCDIPLCLVWDRVLSADEVRRISANPWQIFKQPRLKDRLLFVYSTDLDTINRAPFILDNKVQQPQGTVTINYGNPITKNIVAAYLPNSINSGFGQKELVSGFDDVSNPAYRPAKLFAGKSGLAYSTEAGGVPSLNFTLTGKPSGATPLTIFCLYEPFDTNTVGTIWRGGSNGTYGAGFYKNGDGTVSGFPDTNNGGGFVSASLAVGRAYSLCLTHNKTNSFREFFVDGKSIGSASDSRNNVAGFTFFGSNYAQNTNRRIRVYCAMMWSRILTNSEIQSLSENPWQVFQQANTNRKIITGKLKYVDTVDGRWIPYTEQPSYIVTNSLPRNYIKINPKHPSARNLEFATGPATGIRDAANERVVYDTAVFKSTPFGLSFSTNSQNNFNLPNSSQHSGLCFISVMANTHPWNTSGTSRLWEWGDANSHGMGLNYLGQIQLIYNTNAATPPYFTVTDKLVPLRKIVAIGYTTGSDGTRVFMNGQQIGFTATTRDSRAYFPFRRSRGLTAALNVHFIFAWSRQISNGEMQELSQNPAQIFTKKSFIASHGYYPESGNKGNFFLMF